MRLRRAVVPVAFVAVAASALGADLASVVSEDAVAFAEVTDPKGVWGDFEESGLRDMLRALPNGELQVRLVAGLVHQAALQQFGVRLGEFAERYAPRLALVLLDLPGAGDPPICVLLDASESKPALSDLLRNTVEAQVRRSHPDAAFADEVHQGVAVRRLAAQGRQVAYAFVDDVLAVGPAAGVTKLLDGRVQRPLATNQAFVRVRQRLAVPKGLVAYLNVRRLLADFRPQLEANPEIARKLDDLGLTTVQWAAWAAAFDGRGIRDRLYLFTGDRRVGLLRLLGSLSPGASAAALVVPAESQLLASLTFQDGPELWQAILDYLEEGGQVEHLARLDANHQTIRFRFGIDFDRDVVDALGGEIFLAANPEAVAAQAATGRWPKPGDFPHIIGLRIAKPDAMKATVHRFLASQPLMGRGVDRKVETYGGTEVSTLILPGRPVQPAYAFVGDYLLVARGSDAIRRCIDARANSQGLASVARFKAFLTKMPAKYNGMVYVDLETLLVAALTRGRGAGGPGPLPPRLVLAGQVRSVYAAVTAENDGILLETYTRPGLAGILSFVAGLAPRAAAVPKAVGF